MITIDDLAKKYRQEFVSYLTTTNIDLKDHRELARIVKHAAALAGGQIPIADALGVSQPTISRWVEGGTEKLKRYERIGIIVVLRAFFK